MRAVQPCRHWPGFQVTETTVGEALQRIAEIAREAVPAARYPPVAAACLTHGVHSTRSLPMAAGDVALSSMNLSAMNL